MSHPYRIGNPAFPALPVSVYQLEGSVHTELLSALLDTGADGSLMPEALLASVQADRLRQVRIHSHWGETRVAMVYLVDLEVAGQRLPAVEVVADNQGEDVLLGRNVLNRLILLLDGPTRATDVLNRRPARF